MKKIILALVAVVSVSALFAQVKYSDLSLSEAIVKAKSENKKVLVMGSATW